jgi:hypothetical protein
VTKQQQQALDLGAPALTKDFIDEWAAWEPILDGDIGFEAACGAVKLSVYEAPRTGDVRWCVRWTGDVVRGKADDMDQAKRDTVAVARKLLRESLELLEALERDPG